MNAIPEVTQFQEVMETWRKCARERNAAEPTHAEYLALLLSLDAVAEAIGAERSFSWACSHEKKIAAQDYAIRRKVL